MPKDKGSKEPFRSEWKQIPLGKLFPNPDNVNELDARVASRLKNSLSKWGFLQNLVVMPSKKKPNRFMVLSGNHRLAQLQAEWTDQATPEPMPWCVVVPWLSKPQRGLLAESLNQIHGSPNKENARELFQSIIDEAGGKALDDLLGHRIEVHRLIEESDESIKKVRESAEAEQDEETEKEANSSVDPSGHTLRLAPDALEPNSVIRGDTLRVQFPKHYFDAIITDPPYKIGSYENKWDQGDDVYTFTKDWLPRHLDSLKPGGYVAIFVNARQYDLVTRAVRECKLIVRDPLFWIHYVSKISGARLDDKGLVYTNMKNCVETVVLAQKEPNGTYRANFKKYGVGGLFFAETLIPFIDKADRKSAMARANNIVEAARQGKITMRGYRSLQASWRGWLQTDGRRPCNLIVLPGDEASLPKSYRRYFVTPTVWHRSKESVGHEHQKPLPLMSWLVRLLCPPGGRVGDFFAGSGTTVIAALGNSREAVGVEQSKKNWLTAKGRIEKWKHKNKKWLKQQAQA